MLLDNEKNHKFLQQHSGRSMESVVRLAYQDMLSRPGTDSGLTLEALQADFDRFKTNINERMYELQTLLAVAACNETSFISKPEEQYTYGFRGLDDLIQKAIDKRSNEPLEERIIELKNSVRF